MIVVGIQIGIRSGCAVYKNGRIEFAVGEERYSNVKNDTAFPDQAIRAAMSYCRLVPEQIDAVVLVSRNMKPEHFLVGRECRFTVKDYLREQKEYYWSSIFDGKKPEFLDVFREFIDPRYAELFHQVQASGEPMGDTWNKWRVDRACSILGTSHNKVHIVNHEYSHAAYGFYGSPFRSEDTLIVTFDGFGDEANALIAEMRNGRIHFLRRYTNFNVGRIYRYITLLLGMKPNDHEYKVMGLAPYANAHVKKDALAVFKHAYGLDQEGAVVVDPNLRDHFYYYKERLEGQRFDAIAGGLQEFAEDMTKGLVSHWLKRTCKKSVVLSGGVSLNIKANMEIGKLEEVKNLFVPGSGGDESLCIGGIYAYLDELGMGANIEPLESLYLGPVSEQNDCDKAVRDLADRVPIEVTPNASSQVVGRHLASGKVIARVAGRMEFGARALGNRSILADPRSSNVIRKINEQIKRRDFWMPFTPSILDSSAHRYLKNPKGFEFPYMSVGCETTAEAQAELPGALHPVDFTARAQVVFSKANQTYHDLLSAFRQETGVGALLNTSLNLHGYPIARTPTDASFVFENSQLDGLLLGTTLVLRKIR